MNDERKLIINITKSDLTRLLDLAKTSIDLVDSDIEIVQRVCYEAYTDEFANYYSNVDVPPPTPKSFEEWLVTGDEEMDGAQ